MDIKPGEITDPHWHGPRCGICARPVGGDGSMWKTCDDVPQAHATMDGIPADMRNKFFLEKAWDNALRMVGIADAIEWMTAGRKGQRPIDRLKAGDGEAVLHKQFEEWPRLAREVDVARRLRAA